MTRRTASSPSRSAFWLQAAEAQEKRPNALGIKKASQPAHCTHPCNRAHVKDRASQRSLHNTPIFRLLLKVAVNGTHQCDSFNFCGSFGPQPTNTAGRLPKCILASPLASVIAQPGLCNQALARRLSTWRSRRLPCSSFCLQPCSEAKRPTSVFFSHIRYIAHTSSAFWL